VSKLERPTAASAANASDYAQPCPDVLEERSCQNHTCDLCGTFQPSDLAAIRGLPAGVGGRDG
jgi:hypothetical protein